MTPSTPRSPPPKIAFSDHLSDFTADSRLLLISAMAIVVGVIATFVAFALLTLISAMTNLVFYHRFSTTLVSPASHSLGWWVVVVPILGGLAIGLMARFGSERIRGHGIPEAIESILLGGSKVQPKLALLKPVSAAVSIGTGGPFGAEGPIIMTGGAFGSIFAQFFHLSASERKTLLVAGAAAGMAAVFSAPVAAVMLAVELLLFEWKPRSIVPVVISSVVAAILRVPLMGAGPIFPVPAVSELPWQGLVAAAGLGIVAGLASALLTMLVYGFEDAFAKIPIHWMWWPAIGGLVIGLGGLIEPRVLGVGYDTIGLLLAGQIVASIALGILVGKAIVWACALGSGTSGGVLAPLLMMGAGLGVIASGIIPLGNASVWAIIGMAAMMSGTMRLPFTGMIFTLELTHAWTLLLPLLVGCTAAYGLTVLLLRRSILTEKLARRGHHVMREYAVDPLEMLRVHEAMTHQVEALPADMPAADVARFFQEEKGGLRKHQGYPVVDGDRRVVGVVTRTTALEWTVTPPPAGVPIGKLLVRPVVTAFPDEPTNRAAARMARSAVGRLPVVDRHTGELLGIISRSDLLAARLRQLVEETDRHQVLPPDVRVLAKSVFASDTT